MKVFVTGATGVVGRPTVRELVRAGHEVRAVSRRPEAAAELRAAGAEPVTVDLFDAAAVADAVAGSEAVLHLATHVPETRAMRKPDAWALHDRLRTEATEHLAAASRAAGVRRFVKESVTFMYRDGADRWLAEDAPLPADLGTLAPTVAGEQRALALASDASRVFVLRFGWFYGGAGNRATDEMLRLARWRGSMLAGRAGDYTSSIHVYDAARAVVAALDAPDLPTGIYNVVDEEPLTRRDHLAAFAAAFGTRRAWLTPGWLLRLVAGPGAAVLLASQRVSNGSFREHTGWAPEFPSVREGWRQVAAEHREAVHA
jgi:nucleoside-diphosphate-sugar epimerase